MALRQEAVLVNAGSYTINPKSSSDTLIWRKSIALTMPSDVGIWYVRPVRLSVMVSVLSLMAQISPPIAWRYIRADNHDSLHRPRELLGILESSWRPGSPPHSRQSLSDDTRNYGGERRGGRQVAGRWNHGQFPFRCRCRTCCRCRTASNGAAGAG